MLNNPAGNDPHVATSATSATANDAPEPLWDKETEMPEYPLNALGVLEKPVRAFAELSNAHIVTCAQSVLAVAALATQGLADVEYPNGSRVPTSLFLLTIAESGDGKTACDSFATRPIKVREKEMQANYASDQDDPEESTSRIPPILTCPEPTYEGFYKLLLSGHPSQGIFSDEGGQFVGGFSMRETRESLLSNLSSLWGGGTLKRVRLSDKPSALNGKRASLHLMLQPIVAQRLVKDQYIKGQGFLARCLIAYPPSMAGKRFFKKPTEQALKESEEYNELILRILRIRLAITNPGRVLNPKLLKLNPLQETRWTNFQNEMESLRAEGEMYHPIREFVVKLGENALRLAGVLTLVSDPEANEIADSTLDDAIALARFYVAEALRIEEKSLVPPEIRDAQVLLKWLTEKQKTTFSKRDIQNKGPNSIRSKFLCERALGVLVAKRWVIEPTQKGELYRMYNA